MLKKFEKILNENKSIDIRFDQIFKNVILNFFKFFNLKKILIFFYIYDFLTLLF
jgi:hypothetical protein